MHIRTEMLAAVAALQLVSCSSDSSSDSEETQVVEADSVVEEELPESVDAAPLPIPGDGENPETAGAAFDAAAVQFQREYEAYAQSCIATTTLFGGDFKYFLGFVEDASSNFSNYALASMSCEFDNEMILQSLAQTLIDLDSVKYVELLRGLTESTGLQAHFDSISASAGDGLVIIDKFWDNAASGLFYVMTFDASASGSSTISISLGDQSISSDVEIYTYTSEQIAVGKERYDNGFGESPSCASCHQQVGGVDHGPLLIGTCSDIEVVGAITAAAYTPDETNPNSFCTGYELSVDHSWEFESLEQQLAVIAYLRTLPLNISE